MAQQVETPATTFIARERTCYRIALRQVCELAFWTQRSRRVRKRRQAVEFSPRGLTICYNWLYEFSGRRGVSFQEVLYQSPSPLVVARRPTSLEQNVTATPARPHVCRLCRSCCFPETRGVNCSLNDFLLVLCRETRRYGQALRLFCVRQVDAYKC